MSRPSAPGAPRRSATLIWIAIAAVAVVVALVLVIRSMMGPEETVPDVPAEATAEQLPEQASDGGGASDAGGAEVVAPPGVDTGVPYLTFGDGDVVVDVYTDFLCPYCTEFSKANMADLQRMIEDGEITLRMHPRPMLDARSTPPGYSGRAANAAVCSYAEDPGSWFAAEEALFGIQEQGQTMSAEEIAATVQQAAGTDVAACVAEGTYVPWIQQVVEPEAVQAVQGTPTVLIDGTLAEGDFYQPGPLAEAIAAAR